MDARLASSLAHVDEAVAQLIEAADSLPPALQAPAEWGPREMLAHIVFAHEMYVRNLRAVNERRKPPLFEGRYHDQNARALDENRGATLAQMTQRLAIVHEEFRVCVAQPPAQAAPFYFKAGAKTRTLTQALEAISGHVRGHTRDIRKLARLQERLGGGS